MLRKLLLTAAATLALQASAATILVEGEAFQFKGKWVVEKSSDCLGTAMLRVYQDAREGGADDALTVLSIPEAGKYRVWIRSQDFSGSVRPRTYTLSIDGKTLAPAGAHGVPGFYWEAAGEVELSSKNVLLRLADTGHYFGRCDAILLTSDTSVDPNTLTNTEIARWRRNPATMEYSTVSAPGIGEPLDIVSGYTTLVSASNDDIRISFVRLPDSGTIVCKTDFYAAGSWRRYHSTAEDNRVALLAATADAPAVTFNHNQFYPAWENTTASRTFTFEGTDYPVIVDGDSSNPFYAAALSEARATAVTKTAGNCIKVTYDCGTAGTLTGYWTVPEQGCHISVRMIFRPAAAGTYSIALHAAKGVPDAGVSGGLMPPMFAARRLPATPQMLFSAMMPQCISAVSTDAAYGTATAFVAAEPTDLGTDWGSYDYSPVGFTLRNSAGEMQPVSFSPLPGMSDSKVKAGRTVEAHFNTGITAGTWADALEYAGSDIFGLTDYRRPSTSLTSAMQNIVRLIKDDFYSGWEPALKGFWDIEADGTSAPTVVQSAPLALVGAATLAHDEELYEKRALPAIEYTLSRAGYRTRANTPYALDVLTSQFPTTLYEGINTLTGDLNPWLSEVAMPQGATRQANGYFSTLRAFRQEISAYRLTADESRLDRARALADAYTDEITAGNLPEMAAGSFYNSQMCHDWTPLLDMYRITGEERYLEAASLGAAHTIAGIKTWPRVPGGMHTVHPGGTYDGVTTVWWKGPKQFRLGFPRKDGDSPEHEVEAWSVSPVGLGMEQPATYFLRTAGKTVRPVFMSSWAPRLMELAALTGKDVFDTYGRNAVIGRAASYPGYYATGYTDITASARFPYEGPDVSSIYYHHIPAYLAMIQDCLVTEITTRSGGRVEFGRARQEGFVWFANNISGGVRGTIDGEEARLWMPAGSVTVDDEAVNVLTARNASRFFIMLTNDGNSDCDARVALSDALLSHVEADRTFTARLAPRELKIMAFDADFADMTAEIPALTHGMTSEQTGTPAGGVHLFRIRSPFGWDSLYGYADCSAVSGLTVTAECNGISHTASAWPYEWSFARFGYYEPAEVKITIAQNGVTLKTLTQTLTPATSGVENVTLPPADAAARKGIYTLDGIRIERITRQGLYIVDGKIRVY